MFPEDKFRPRRGQIMCSRGEGSEMLERQDRKWEMQSPGFASFRPSARDAKAFGVREIGIEPVESPKIGEFLYLRSFFPNLGNVFPWFALTVNLTA